MTDNTLRINRYKIPKYFVIFREFLLKSAKALGNEKPGQLPHFSKLLEREI